MGAGAGLIGPALSLGSSAASKGGGGGGGSSGAPVMTENPAAVSNIIGNQFAASGGMGGPGTFNSPMRLTAQITGANQAAAGNATANANLAAAQGAQMASLQNQNQFAQGFNTPTGNTGSTDTSSTNELGTSTGDPVIS